MPAADLRSLYYGLLGAQATSITPHQWGASHVHTVGQDGAYLIVTDAPTEPVGNQETVGLMPALNPITEVHYRGGSTCDLTATSTAGGADACTPALQVPAGYAARNAPMPTQAQVESPLHVRQALGQEGRHEIFISFISRVDIKSVGSQYLLEWRSPGQPPQVKESEPMRANIKAGETGTCASAGSDHRSQPARPTRRSTISRPTARTNPRANRAWR